MTLQMIQEFVGGAISERKRTVTPHSSLSGGRRERLLLTVLRFFNIFPGQRHQVFLGDGGEGGWDHTSNSGIKFKDLFKEFRKINPGCLTVCCNIRAQSGTSVFNPNLKILNVSGWSNNIFDVISMYKAGKLKSMVEDIDSMSV